MTLDDIARELKTVRGLTANDRAWLRYWLQDNMRDESEYEPLYWGVAVREIGRIVAAAKAKAVAVQQRKAR